MESLKQGEYSGDIKFRKDSGGIIASVTSYDSQKFNGEMHYHSNPHFGFTVEGGCVERKFDQYELAAGDISYYMTGEQHQVLRVARPSTRVNLEIEQYFMAEYGLSDQGMRNAVLKEPNAKFLMVTIYNELLTGDDCSAVAIESLLLDLFHRSEKLVNKKNVPSWVRTVCDFLRVNCDGQLTLKEIAHIAGVHPVTLSKYFARYVGCNLGDYVRKLRVEKAIGLIKGSDRSMTTIASECGFFDQSHFNRSFKRYNGILPGRYKKLQTR